MHIGIFIALAVTVAVWLLIEHSRWGFKAKVVGGNPEAARRGGIPVNKTVMVALLLGGAIAGLAGAIELCGIEFRLQTGMATGFGYTVQRRTAQVAVLTRVIPRVRDIRRMGAASLDLCSVAAGTLDAYYERGLKPWDHAAGGLVAAEAGAVTGGLDGGIVESCQPTPR